ncbi:M24 family metallopeptidase [Sulfurospirillum sp. 1612]|uniref:M24 family metallopeptidase n=1 Tax=Sulfurospirillum sp. 1612 TaxID=3094835 RepID=UPI002F92FC88
MNYILKDENAVYYECGFSCDNEIFLKLEDAAYFLTDARYITEAKEYIKNAEVVEMDRRDPMKVARTLLRKSKIATLIYNPYEWSVGEFERLSSKLNINFSQKVNFSQQKRIIKSDHELDILRVAARKGADAFDAFAAFVRERGIGLNEKRLFNEAENIFKNYGELELSFSPIVALGANAAKPHALPSDDVLRESELLLLDAGVKYQRYCSDRTRTAEVSHNMVFEKNMKFKDALRQKVYDTVLKAHDASIKKAKAGVRASEIDRAGREVIEKAGFGQYFIHSTGHGVGLDIHELPVIGARSQDIIEENMVFTIEPGIYLPGEFGVRIEDTVIARETDVEIIS